jgi:hypothetical protein
LKLPICRHIYNLRVCENTPSTYVLIAKWIFLFGTKGIASHLFSYCVCVCVFFSQCAFQNPMQFTGKFDTISISFSIPKKKERKQKKIIISLLFQ